RGAPAARQHPVRDASHGHLADHRRQPFGILLGAVRSGRAALDARSSAVHRRSGRERGDRRHRHVPARRMAARPGEHALPVDLRRQRRGPPRPRPVCAPLLRGRDRGGAGAGSDRAGFTDPDARRLGRDRRRARRVSRPVPARVGLHLDSAVPRHRADSRGGLARPLVPAAAHERRRIARRGVGRRRGVLRARGRVRRGTRAGEAARSGAAVAPPCRSAYNHSVIPLRDTIPSRTAPLVTVALIAVNVLVFCVGCGLVAALTQVALSPDSTIPTVGASGAIAGVLGAYLISFPRSRVLTLVVVWLVEIPAIAYLAFWFLLQVFSGVASLGRAEMAGGVAWWAHIGGFLAGIVGVALFAPPPRPPRVRELPL